MDILELAKNIDNVKSNIAKVCLDCNRQNDVILVGASKTMSQDVIDAVNNNNLLNVLGENRVQELIQKYRDGQNFEWHFIGKLQSNKVKYIIDKVALIHSVDSLRLAETIEKEAAKRNITVNILIEVNVAREEVKVEKPVEAAPAVEEEKAE